MELVEGETIAARLKSGPLLLKTSLLYASQTVARWLRHMARASCTEISSRRTSRSRNP
jgi:hypothetical protein